MTMLYSPTPSNVAAPVQTMLEPVIAVPKGTVGIVFDKYNNVIDYAYTPETCIQYANAGFRVNAITDDITQTALDNELDIAIDCFGEEHRR